MRTDLLVALFAPRSVLLATEEEHELIGWKCVGECCPYC